MLGIGKARGHSSRKLGKHNYHFVSTFSNKQNAKHAASSLRKYGKKARVIKSSDGYDIYTT